MIKLEGVQKNYGSRRVLDIPALALSSGKRYALIGPNGSGKSTLLRLLAGVLQPDAGHITLPGELERSRGYMPQRPYAYGFSVLKNVRIALPGKQPSAEALAKSALAEVGMTPFLQARGHTLSGGEAQRMAFARMLAGGRRLLLLDEPTSATDIASAELVETALQRYCRRTGCTLVIATHALAQAERLADHVILLDHGRVIASGPAEEVLYEQQNEQADRFLKFWRLEKNTTPTDDAGGCRSV